MAGGVVSEWKGGEGGAGGEMGVKDSEEMEGKWLEVGV